MNIYLYNLSYYRVRDGPTPAPIKSSRPCQDNVVIQVKFVIVFFFTLSVHIWHYKYRHVIRFITQELIGDGNQVRKLLLLSLELFKSVRMRSLIARIEFDDPKII